MWVSLDVALRGRVRSLWGITVVSKYAQYVAQILILSKEMKIYWYIWKEFGSKNENFDGLAMNSDGLGNGSENSNVPDFPP